MLDEKKSCWLSNFSKYIIWMLFIIALLTEMFSVNHLKMNVPTPHVLPRACTDATVRSKARSVHALNLKRRLLLCKAYALLWVLISPNF